MKIEIKAQPSATGLMSAAEDMRRFYDIHKGICDKSYKYYKEYDRNKHSYVSSVLRIRKNKFKKLLLSTTVLVLTANPVEQAVLLHWLADKTGSPLPTYMVGGIACNLARLDDITVVHVHAKDTGDEFTRRALNKVRGVFKPTYVFLLGICYGFDMDRHSIGSVFISNRITSYHIDFRDDDKTDETHFVPRDEYEGQPKRDFIESLESAFNFIQTKNVLSNDDEPITARVEFGRLLCCNSLMSSTAVKEEIRVRYTAGRPKPLGGEMEGGGLLKSNLYENDKFGKWSIVKAVCDWGEKKNSLDEDPDESERIKDSLQAFAMANACGAFDVIIACLTKGDLC